MAADPFDTLRLTLMQQVLPVGLALAERFRRGGPAEVAAVLDGQQPSPLDALRQEGEPAASRVREQLDQLSPGLGNPVMPVEVREVEPAAPPPAEDPEPEALVGRLQQIALRLGELERRLGPGA